MERARPPSGGGHHLRPELRSEVVSLSAVPRQENGRERAGDAEERFSRPERKEPKGDLLPEQCGASAIGPQ